MPTLAPLLPLPPEELAFPPVALHFAELVPGDALHGLVPSYHFRIVVNGAEVGHLNLRVGHSDHVWLVAGHIGYEIAAAHRGQRYALSACRALAPFARSLGPVWILTCDPENGASRRTLELLGVAFLGEVPVPWHDPHYARGSRTKLRFQWTP